MEGELAKFYIILLCRKYGENTLNIILKRLKEFFKTEDLADIVLTLAYLLGMYDPKTGKLLKRVSCIDLSDVLTEDIIARGKLLEDVIKKRVDISLKVSLSLLGGVEGLKSTSKEIIENLSPHEARMLLREIEESRRKMSNLEDFTIIESDGGIVIRMRFSKEKYAKLLEETKAPTPGMIFYALLRAYIDGYKDVEISSIEIHDSEIYVEFKFKNRFFR